MPQGESRPSYPSGRLELLEQAAEHEVGAAELAELAQEFARLGYLDYAEALREMRREHLVEALQLRVRAAARERER